MNTYKRELKPMLRDISNTLAPPSENVLRDINKENQIQNVNDYSGCSAQNVESDDSTLVLNVPSCVKTVVIVKGDKK